MKASGVALVLVLTSRPLHPVQRLEPRPLGLVLRRPLHPIEARLPVSLPLLRRRTPYPVVHVTPRSRRKPHARDYEYHGKPIADPIPGGLA